MQYYLYICVPANLDHVELVKAADILQSSRDTKNTIVVLSSV